MHITANHPEMKVDISNPWHCFLLLQQGFFTLLATIARIFLAIPERKVVVLYGHQFSGNLKALYEEWRQSDSKHQLNLFFMSLDPEHISELKCSGIQALQCNKLSDMLVIAKSSAIISDHGLHLLSLLVFVTDIVFVDVWHGIPFKGFTPGDFHLQRRYDEVWVSSPFMKFIYERKFGFRPERVHALGYARTDKLFKYPNTISSFRQLASIPRETRIVLSAPTWQQDDAGRELVPFGETT
ncbi:MAG: CDP-glycerol glycerophosphotransferase family protein, partial [Methylococcales bacterium]